ncbi:MAG TPA: type II toxin-antitoxin system RelE/ParE family toxin [Candidatus Thermoplasmatota archaeon]|nr:type II toxin-antitoxin system RelE/ParE family toxin [Candidatus Thermoplasmatota archaeon]
MTWRLDYSDSARRDLRALDHAVAQQVLRKLDSIRKDPLRSMKRLKGSKDWRLRVGDWRVVAQADATARLLTVKRVQHRSVVYG